MREDSSEAGQAQAPPNHDMSFPRLAYVLISRMTQGRSADRAMLLSSAHLPTESKIWPGDGNGARGALRSNYNSCADMMEYLGL